MKFVKRQVDEVLYQSYGDDVKNFLKPIYARRGFIFSEKYLSLTQLLPPNFKQLDIALSRLYQAILKQENILIIGDFDADGATACAVMIKSLRQMGAKFVDFLVPNRFQHGYGLSVAIVQLAQKEKQPNLIITVDNGISSADGVDLANKYGIDVIITDHHLPPSQLPKALATINPNLDDCPFASKNLAGVGVAFYLCVALKTYLQKLNFFVTQDINLPDLRQLLDLVALGTVADMVKLDLNNRILVKAGLDLIKKQHACVGITALLMVANKSTKRIKSSDFGFAIAPRINAAGRLKDISIGIRCLISEDFNIALEYANELNTLNESRKAVQSDMQEQAKAILLQTDIQTNPFSICLYQSDWHEGVVGIVAGKLCRDYHCPSVIFAKNGLFLKGSLRSIEGVHLKDLLTEIDRQYPNLITQFGGHALAAGMSLKVENFEQFSQLFDQFIRQALNNKNPHAVLLTDSELIEQEITLENAQLIEDNAPWGQGFEEPIFSGYFAIDKQKVIGEKHLKCQLRLKGGQYWFDAIAFFQQPIDKKYVNMAYKLSVNDYQGSQSLQLMIEYIL